MGSALIEARSCERFALLAAVCGNDRELRKLYKGLGASEHGHYLSFLDLAQAVETASRVERRWKEMLREEARIIADQTPGPRMHSGVG